MLNQSQILAGLEQLGITQAEIAALQSQSSFEAACVMLVKLKARAKKTFRKRALELHPDKTGGDLVKTELLKVASQVNDEIQKLEMRLPAPPQPSISHFVQFRTADKAASWPPGVVFVKIR